MKSAFLALMLILQIASGLSGESPFSQKKDGMCSSVLCVRDITLKGCLGKGDCIGKLYSSTDEGYKKREDYSELICKCRDFLPNSVDGSYKNTRDLLDKRSVIDKSSYLLMKLHPLLNRGVGPTSMKVQNRYRRLGVRLGSEFLGKRNIIGKDTELWDVDLESIDGPARKRAPATELLGKRWGSEMLGKRNVEMLGKRGVEFLGKRGTEFLGKRGYYFPGENVLISWLCKKLEDGPAKYVYCPQPRGKLSEFAGGVNAENNTVRKIKRLVYPDLRRTQCEQHDQSWYQPK